MSERDKTASRVLEDLFTVIESRRGGDAKTSYTAKLLEGGTGKITEKIDEEAAEVVAAALGETPGRVVAESADLLYHLLVLWADKGIAPADVMAELQSRAGTSGIEEKKNRQGKN